MSNSNDTAKSNLSALSPSPEGVTYGEVEVQPVKKMPAAAVRALAEAEERRVREDAAQEPMAKELLGQKGPEPTRYGDWEKKGLTSDF